MSRSFSVYDYKGIELKGTTLFEDQIKQFAIVAEEPGPISPAVWLVDLLEDVGISLEPDQVPVILPVLRDWAIQYGAVFVPVSMVLNCPRCGRQHIDKEETEVEFHTRIEKGLLEPRELAEGPSRWSNPPHKSHTCQYCQTIWRPAPFETVGVESINSRGKADNWPPIGTINLIINGEPTSWNMSERTISYEGVVDLLAYQKFPTQRPHEFLWTITYHNKYRTGTLSPGQSVEVDDGLRFTAVVTSGA